MEQFQINGASATGGTSGNYELKAHDDKNKFVNSSFGDGFGAASGGGQANSKGLAVQSSGNQNSFYENSTYTKADFPQLKKYGDNIANDINNANNRLGSKYSEIESDLIKTIRSIGNNNDPISIAAQSYLEDLHNMKATSFKFAKGGKEANYKDAQKLVEQYEARTMEQLNRISKDSASVTLLKAKDEIIENTNQNAAMNAAVTVATGEAIMDNDDANAADINANVDREGAATRKAVHSEGAATRKTVRNEGAKTRSAVHAEGQMTRFAVHAEGTMTRNTVRAEGAKTRNVVREEAVETRNTVRKTGHETQELDALSDKISDVLGNKDHLGATKKSVGDIRDKIVQSNLSHEEKKEMLNDLAEFSNQVVISDRELLDKHTEVNNRLADSSVIYGDLPGYEEAPEREIPMAESPYPNVVGRGGEPSTNHRVADKKPNTGGKPPVETEKKPEDRPVDTPPADGETKVPFAPPKPKVLEPFFKKKQK